MAVLSEAPLLHIVILRSCYLHVVIHIMHRIQGVVVKTDVKAKAAIPVIPQHSALSPI